MCAKGVRASKQQVLPTLLLHCFPNSSPPLLLPPPPLPHRPTHPPVSMSVWKRLDPARGEIMFILVSCPISSALLGVKEGAPLRAGVTWKEKPAQETKKSEVWGSRLYVWGLQGTCGTPCMRG